jgi:phosphohistidine phosphatase SixA
VTLPGYNARLTSGARMASRFDVPRRKFLLALGGPFLLLRVVKAQSPAEVLVAAIQDGGKVIYLRHATTNQHEVDTGRLGDRGGQRNLSPDGIRQAERLGHALRALRVPLNEILASPVFRARDTAELAFGEDQVKVTMDLVADEYAGNQLTAMLEATKGPLRTLPGPGMNRILVGHRTPLEMATGRMFPDSVLPEGAMAVFLPGAIPQLLGTITADRVVLSAESRGALRR